MMRLALLVECQREPPCCRVVARFLVTARLATLAELITLVERLREHGVEFALGSTALVPIGDLGFSNPHLVLVVPYERAFDRHGLAVREDPGEIRLGHPLGDPRTHPARILAHGRPL